MFATNTGRVLYSGEVQQPERTTPVPFDRDQAEQPGQATAVLGLPMFCIQIVSCVRRARCVR